MSNAEGLAVANNVRQKPHPGQRHQTAQVPSASQWRDNAAPDVIRLARSKLVSWQLAHCTSRTFSRDPIARSICRALISLNLLGSVAGPLPYTDYSQSALYYTVRLRLASGSAGLS